MDRDGDWFAWLQAGGRMSRDGFMALMGGAHPVDGSLLRRMTERSRVAAIDLTFSAPKSVSVLTAVCGGEVSDALVQAHERAVSAAVGYLEREACLTRRGHGGVERTPGEGFVAAAYRHRLSRAGDPQLHTHVVVANLTRADGRFTALDARAPVCAQVSGRGGLPGGPTHRGAGAVAVGVVVAGRAWPV